MTNFGVVSQDRRKAHWKASGLSPEVRGSFLKIAPGELVVTPSVFGSASRTNNTFRIATPRRSRNRAFDQIPKRLWEEASKWKTGPESMNPRQSVPRKASDRELPKMKESYRSRGDHRR